MIGSAMTKMRWLQMISVKDCGQIVNGSMCPCANKLRLVILRIPTSIYEENPVIKIYLNRKLNIMNAV